MNRFRTILRAAILIIALAGLVTAPLAAYASHAHAAVMSEMAEDTPCCPENSHHDCTKCALATACMSHCVQFFWQTTAYPSMPQAARQFTRLAANRFIPGSDPAPPFRPPNG